MNANNGDDPDRSGFDSNQYRSFQQSQQPETVGVSSFQTANEQEDIIRTGTNFNSFEFKDDNQVEP